MEEQIELYKKIAASGDWPEIKEAFARLADSIRDVSNLEDVSGMTGYDVSLGSIYLGKMIASKKIADIIFAIDSLRDKPQGESSVDFE